MRIGISYRNVVILGLITMFIPKGLSSHQIAVGSKSDDIKLLPNQETCGIQFSDRIYGGTQTDIDEYPWTALLKYRTPLRAFKWAFLCAGALISSRYVLTAAHCVVNEKNATESSKQTILTHVRLGEWDLKTYKDCLESFCSDSPIDVPVEKIITHEGYEPSDPQTYNDITLLRLSQSVQFTDFIRPICLPLADDLRNADFLGYDLQVAGWGFTENGTRSNVKMKVQVPVVDNERCNEVYNTKDRIVITKQICAGGMKGEDSCGFDSGSSLMGRVPPADNWLAIGIVSYGGVPCGSRGWPAVHTKVGAYLDWILSKLEP